MGESQYGGNFTLFKERLKQYGRVGKQDVKLLWRYVQGEPLTQRELNRKDLLLKRLKITVKWLLLLAGMTYGFRKMRKAWQKAWQKEEQEEEQKITKLEYPMLLHRELQRFSNKLSGIIHNLEYALFSRERKKIPYIHNFDQGGGWADQTGHIPSNKEASLFLTIANETNHKFELLRFVIDNVSKRATMAYKLNQIAQPFKKIGFIISFDSQAQKRGLVGSWISDWIPDWDFITQQKNTK